MMYETNDLKLKNLIQVCKETGNFERLASVISILINNRLNEMGIHLGVRPRDNNLKENFTEYMELINEIFQKNVGINIFEHRLLEKMSECEQLLYGNRVDISYPLIRTMVKLYYELRRLDVPNLYREFDEFDTIAIPHYSLQSFLSANSIRKHNYNNRSYILRPLLLQKLKEKQYSIQKNAEKNFNRHTLETAILLKKQENSLHSNADYRKITFEGKLKDNLSYQHSIENIVGYFVIGVCVLLLTLGVSMVLKLMTYPTMSSSLSYWSLISVGGGVLLFMVYIKYFIRKRF
ncbi:MAG: hypothetical protein ACFFC3_03705 [Candidatus Odinarchaeota archaeon]